MELKTRIQEDMKTAMRNQEKQRLGAIRLILAAIKQREIDERISLDETQVLAVLEKLRKQRQDSLNQYQAAGRQELADQEAFEIQLIEEYLPTQLTLDEIEQHVDAAMAEVQAKAANDMGKVIAALKPKLQGRADMATVSRLVKERLSSL